MKILGIVTLVSPTGEYGGPVRVAVNQLRELARRGHDVVLAGGARGYKSALPDRIDGVPARLFPARTVLPGAGFAGLTAPGLLLGMRAHAREFDVVHVHAARDLITLPAARIAQRAGVRTVLQTHGMIDESSNPLAAPLDALITRPALRDAAAVTFLTPEEQASLAVVSRDRALLVPLANGVPVPSERAETHRAEQSSADSAPEVLYLARLAARKNPAMFARVAVQLAREFPTARFRLVGPDEGEADEVTRIIDAAGLGERLQWEGPLAPEATLDRMRSASIYVLPSVDEPYPMSVLEAMSVGLPVVVSTSCGLAETVARASAGTVIDAHAESLRSAIAALLANLDEARAAGLRGRAAVRRTHSMPAVAERLEVLYGTPV